MLAVQITIEDQNRGTHNYSFIYTPHALILMRDLIRSGLILKKTANKSQLEPLNRTKKSNIMLFSIWCPNFSADFCEMALLTDLTYFITTLFYKNRLSFDYYFKCRLNLVQDCLRNRGRFCFTWRLALKRTKFFCKLILATFSSIAKRNLIVSNSIASSESTISI